MKRRPKKKPVQCSKCPRQEMRRLARSDVECKRCRKKRLAAWHAEHKTVVHARHRERYLANKADVMRRAKSWAKAHPESVRKKGQRYKQRERARNAELIADLPCLDCGMKHTDEKRFSILHRMLPATAHEIREAWSCIWGLPDEKDAGSRRLYRDLEKLGAVGQGGTFYLSTARAA